jgi:hypothetical protein
MHARQPRSERHIFLRLQQHQYVGRHPEIEKIDIALETGPNRFSENHENRSFRFINMRNQVDRYLV